MQSVMERTEIVAKNSFSFYCQEGARVRFSSFIVCYYRILTHIHNRCGYFCSSLIHFYSLEKVIRVSDPTVMDSREKESKPKESWEKSLLKHIRRESMQQKPNMYLDAHRPVEFHSGESDEITTVHTACFEVFSSFIFSSHSAVSDATVCFPLLDRLL